MKYLITEKYEVIIVIKRSEYAVGNITRQKLADKYGVTIHTIKSIIGRHTWKHI